MGRIPCCLVPLFHIMLLELYKVIYDDAYMTEYYLKALCYLDLTTFVASGG